MQISRGLTDAAVLQALGERIARHRIQAGLTQTELAERAGIGKRTVERVEAGHGAELVTLLRVLRVLGLVDGLQQLIPELPPSPIAQLRLRGKVRQRVAHARVRRTALAGKAPPGVKESDKPWTWGKD
ncbi:MAG TPA: helix-turn-helix domain-containing protein [Steroidobacteraceae bacterium]|nr:helix-turn-helix domain-containing protein [Steroidobacteraceae bacterium]